MVFQTQRSEIQKFRLRFFLISFYQNAKRSELVRRMHLKLLATTSG